MPEMGIYNEIDRELTQQQLEERILEFWDTERIFLRVLEKGKNSPKFVFYEGPPTANGLPGVHHVLARTLKDIVCRYQTMKGFLVERKAGWDTHGLPVEIDVEKELNISTKGEIEKYGIDKFNKKCKESVFRYVNEWEDLTRRIGYWLDMSEPYVTCEPDYIESVWWLLAQFFREGFIYKGHKVLPYCPRCGTGLSDHEVAQGYRDVEDPSITVRMKMKGKENEYFLVWTTTPWTLLSNVALALHPDVNYIKVKHNGEFLWLAEPRLEAVFGEDKPEVIEKVTGSELAGIEYEPLFRFIEPDKKAWFTITADYVTTEDGTGIVHIAPAFGREDYDVGVKYDLPLLQLVEADGSISAQAGPYAGKFFKDADPEILKELESRGHIFDLGTIVHSYPFCWRCESPLIQYARASWYIRTTDYKDDMLAANADIKWFPPEIKDGRFGEWLRNNVDWALSRERYWGTPLPIWVCDDCGHQHAIGGFAELSEMAIEGYSEGMDVHKPFIDKVTLKCPQCGGIMHRVPDVIDCWFDSGAMPFAQCHYPFEHKEDFEPDFFPAAFICEGVDQTRGWFYTLLAIATFIKGKSSYERCLVNGLVQDKDGQKMSKSRGNAVDPVQVIADYGADPLRWYLVTTSAPWLPTRFDTDGVGEVRRTFFDTLRNAFGFFALYANIDGWTPDMPAGEPTMMDLWLRSRFNTLVEEVRTDLDEYQVTRATRKISSFVIDELSNWYIRLSRKRFWGSGLDDDKLACYRVLYDALSTVSRLIAPFVPITADIIWRGLNENLENVVQSVHLTEFPSADESNIDIDLEKEMAFAERVVTMGRNARQEANLKIRQPLSRLIISEDSGEKLPGWATELIKKELNVKAVESAKRGNLFSYSVKPDYKVLGPRFGKYIKELGEVLAGLPSDTIEKAVKTGTLEITIAGEKTFLDIENDLITETTSIKGLSVAFDDDLAVALDTALTEELIAEGLARELVNRIQNTRKQAGFGVTDRIAVGIETAEEIATAIETHSGWIRNEVLAVELKLEQLKDAEFTKNWVIDENETVISVRRI